LILRRALILGVAAWLLAGGATAQQSCQRTIGCGATAARTLSISGDSCLDAQARTYDLFSFNARVGDTCTVVRRGLCLRSGLFRRRRAPRLSADVARAGTVAKPELLTVQRRRRGWVARHPIVKNNTAPVKRLWSLPRWAERTRRVQRDVQKAKLCSPATSQETRERIRLAIARQRNQWRAIEAPRMFSLVHNAEEVLEFFTHASKLLNSGVNIAMDFRAIQQLTPDAIAFLVASIRDRKFTHGMSVVGNEPDDPALRQMWDDSGFHSHVQSRLRISAARGRFARKGSVQVSSPDAKALVRFATTCLYGAPRKWPTVQRTLVECMTNTRAHAAGRKHSRRSWWGSVHVDNGIARFSFVDRGIGIFKSPLLTRRRHFLRGMGLLSNESILQGLLAGKIPSSTGRKNRGKGFPNMYKDLTAPDRDTIEKLVIISNDVFADVANSKFRTIHPPFPGTFIYWEKR